MGPTALLPFRRNGTVKKIIKKRNAMEELRNKKSQLIVNTDREDLSSTLKIRSNVRYLSIPNRVTKTCHSSSMNVLLHLYRGSAAQHD
jgi:hypothetical protein